MVEDRIYLRTARGGDKQLFKPLICTSVYIPIGFTWTHEKVQRLRWVPFLKFKAGKYPVEVCRHAYKRAYSSTFQERKKINKDLAKEVGGWDGFLAYINSF